MLRIKQLSLKAHDSSPRTISLPCIAGEEFRMYVLSTEGMVLLVCRVRGLILGQTQGGNGRTARLPVLRSSAFKFSSVFWKAKCAGEERKEQHGSWLQIEEQAWFISQCRATMTGRSSCSYEQCGKSISMGVCTICFYIPPWEQLVMQPCWWQKSGIPCFEEL